MTVQCNLRSRNVGQDPFAQVAIFIYPAGMRLKVAIIIITVCSLRDYIMAGYHYIKRII